MTSTRSVQARLERRRAEEAGTFVRAHVMPSADDDTVVGDGELAWLGLAVVLGCVATVIGAAWLALSGRFSW